MKKILLALTVVTLLISCGGSEENTTSEEASEPLESVHIEDMGETESEDVINTEVTEVEIDDRYQKIENICSRYSILRLRKK